MGDAPSTARPRLALPASPLPASPSCGGGREGALGRSPRPLATPACRGDDAHVSAGTGRYDLARVGYTENGVIQFENVGLRYGLGPEILRDLTFHIAPRSFQFLSGPSGAGKSSLLRLLFLTLKPTRGLITLFDHDTATLSAH